MSGSIEDIADNITDKLRNGIDLSQLCNNVTNSCDGWDKYVNFSEEKYTRNIVSRNKYVDVIVISWDIYQNSGLHDHPSDGCIMHILQGNLEEDIYISDGNDLVPCKTNKLVSGNTSFIQGKNGIHNIRNGNTKSVSLHVYSPPNYKINHYDIS